MIRGDSFKLKIPDDFLLSWDGSKLRSSSEVYQDRTVKHCRYASNVGLGLKSITHNLITKELILEGSAKALQDQYFDLINENTVERLFRAYNDTGCITLDIPRAIDHSELLRFDTTQNLVLPDPGISYVNSLNHVRLDVRYNVEPYKKKDNTGIVFMGKQKSFKERQVFYDKLLDVRKDKDLIKAVGLSTLEKQFTGVLRVESNFTQLRKIREYCGGSSNLLHVLRSKANPNHSIFKKITNRYTSLSLFEDYEGYKLMDIEKLEGRKKIVRDLGYDMDLINQFIDSKVAGNNSKYRREYKAVIKSELAGTNIFQINSHLEQIEAQLKVA